MRTTIALALALITLISAANADVRLPQWPSCIVWRPQFVGVGLASVTLHHPRPLRIHALRVNLDAEGLSLVTDKSNGDRELEVDGLKTSSFLLQTDCQAAINASAFWPLQKEEGGEHEIRGLVISDGEIVSRVDEDKPRSAVVIRKDRRAEIVDPPVDTKDVVTAVGGYGDLMRDGAAVAPNEEQKFIDDLHPRTAIGIDDEGRTLILVVVDGRQAGYSEGVSLPELAEIMRLFGADDAVNLDGGGTTTMVVAEPGGVPRQINRPIHEGVPGNERISASHLGIRAALPTHFPQVR